MSDPNATAHELLRRLASVRWPIAPDQVEPDGPERYRARVAGADAVFALLPDGSNTLLHATKDGVEFELSEVMSGSLPPDTVVLRVPCRDEKDVEALRAIIAEEIPSQAGRASGRISRARG